MANTLTGLIPTLYSALDVVSRELVGMIPSVTRDPSTDRAAVGQTVSSFVAPASTATNITPSVTPPNDGDQTIGKKDILITKSRRVPIRWNGEQTLGVDNNGPGQQNIQVQQMAQAFRTLTNEVELDLCGLYVDASRAYGTAGTTPFATTLADSAQGRKMLSDNGAPVNSGMGRMVFDTAAGANLRTLGQLTKANEANDDSMLRQGVLLDLHGFELRESGQIQTAAAGTGASATTDAAGYAVGATTITLASAGTGTIVAGDVITFAGDANKYVVESGDTDVSDGGTITLAAPGLRVAITTSATAITVIAAAARNMAFTENAIVLASRMPALPNGGDLAVDRMTMVDDRSGLAFEIAVYEQYRQLQYEVSLAWGVKTIKPEHLVLLLG